MIRFLRGQYLYYESGAIVIETSGGIGFRVFVSDTSSLLAKREGDELETYPSMQVKEDGMAGSLRAAHNRERRGTEGGTRDYVSRHSEPDQSCHIGRRCGFDSNGSGHRQKDR